MFVSALEEGATHRNSPQVPSFYEHALSFVASTKETTQQTPGGQEETSDGDETRAATNTEVLSKLRERASDSNTAILVIDSAESLLAYINGPASNAKLVVFNLPVRMSVSC